MFPFTTRERHKLTFVPKGRENYVISTNVSGYSSQCFSLVRAGYGSLAQVQDMDSTDFLDALEYEEIIRNIEQHMMDDAKDKKT